MTRRRRLSSAVAVALAVVGGPGAAVAHDHRPPRAELRFGSLLQEGRLFRYHWSSKTPEDGCVSSLIVADPGYPHPGLPVGPGKFRAAVRLSRPDRPTDLRVAAREGRGPGARQPGVSRDVSYTLRPRRAGDEVIGWAAILRSRVDEHLYLRVTGSWDDRQGCLGRQRATWLLHVSAG
jgi:hypothetical protein